MGLPDVRHADGTEIAPHLAMRENFHLVAGVRPVKAYPNVPQRLADPRAADIDFIVLRESTEGLFYSRDKGEVQAMPSPTRRCGFRAMSLRNWLTLPSRLPANARKRVARAA